jgi:predicted O-methyltransferase YrrM
MRRCDFLRPSEIRHALLASRMSMEITETPPPSNYKESREELRRMDVEFPQRDKEFGPLMALMANLRPRNLVEVGTRDGGSLFMLSRVLPAQSTIISVDLPGLAWGRSNSGEKKRRVADRLRQDGFTVHLVERDSSQPETAAEVAGLLKGAPIEALFLDGDHSFRGVLADFRNYQPLMKSEAPLIFHDIAHSLKTPKVEVHYLWRVLKALVPHLEFMESEENGWGIGVAMNIGLAQGFDVCQR